MTRHGTHARREPRSRRSTWAIALATLVVAVAGAAFGADAALHSRFFAANHVVVLGARHESTAAIERVTGLADAPPMLDVDPATVSSRVESAFAWVQSATVTKSWPHTVTISVTERRPVAEVTTKTGRLELVDASGRRLGAPGRGQVLPHLVYPVATSGAVPDALPVSADPGLVVASTLPPAFKWQVALIAVNAQGWVTLRLGSPVSFVLGPANDLGAKYEDVAAVIQSTTLHVGDVVDVSVPEIETVTGP